MMWFFAVLVVLALGGVAAVAAGRGRPMSIEYDDRPDVTVPADQALVEDDVRRVRFSTALLGYRQSEVDALLERLARELGARAELDDRRAAEERAQAARAAQAAEATRAAEARRRSAAAPPSATPTEPVADQPKGATEARPPWWSRLRR